MKDQRHGNRRFFSAMLSWQLLLLAAIISCFSAATTAAFAAVKEMNIVAHQDDDILFMNPDIAKALASNHSIMTVYVTSGDADQGAIYGTRTREKAARAGYALLVGLPNPADDGNWTPVDSSIAGIPNIKIDKMVRASGLAPIYLVFLRLPATDEAGMSFDRSPNYPYGYESLRMLWRSDNPVIDALFDPTYMSNPDPTSLYGDPYLNTWNKAGLIDVLEHLMAWYKPTTIRTQDSTGHTSVPNGAHPDYWYFDNRAGYEAGLNAAIQWNDPNYIARYGSGDTLGLDPTAVWIYYPPFSDAGFDRVPNQYYEYDHADQFYAGLFAKAAVEDYVSNYGVRVTFRIYHGYNTAAKPANITGTDLSTKQAIFAEYGSIDPGGQLDGTNHYASWLQRQYGATIEP